MAHHAYIIAGEQEASVAAATAFLAREYGLALRGNPDLVVRRYSLFSVEDARSLLSFASLTSVTGQTKALVIATDRMYNEAQNALLKLLEEPPEGTVIVLCVPRASMLLPTVRSRAEEIIHAAPGTRAAWMAGARSAPAGGKHLDDAQIFLQATKEKRTALIKKIVGGKDEDARRAGRDMAIRIVDGVERAARGALEKEDHPEKREALFGVVSDIETLRSYLYDRAAPVRMILEHLSLVLPKF